MALTSMSGERHRLSGEDIIRARALREGGLTFAEVATALSQGYPGGVTTQQVWQAVVHSGGDPLQDGGRGASAARFAARWGEQTRAMFDETRDPSETASRLGLAERAVRRYLADEELLHLSLPAGSDQLRARRWKPAEMEEVLREASMQVGEPLSLSKYERWAAETDHGAPSQRTIAVHYGSWRAACVAAGVRPGDSSRVYQPGVSAAECLAAVAEYVRECAEAGTKATMTGYEQISAKRGWPCRNTVVVRCASENEHHRSWRSIVKEVLGRTGEIPGRSAASGPARQDHRDRSSA